MKKTCVAMMFCMLICSCLIFLQSVAAEENTGNILYVGGTGDGNYSSIQDAINASNSGDTIYVYNGTYFENLLINKSISLIGENKYSTIIDGDEKGTVISIIADVVNITSFTIQNSGKYFTACSVSGIAIHSNFNNISKNIITNNYLGISLSRDVCYPYIFTIGSRPLSFRNHNVISGNMIINNTIGISLESSSNSIIIENSVINYYNYSATDFKGKSGIHILSEGESRGITFVGKSSNNSISLNNITGHKYSILLSSNLSKNNTIYKNTMTNNNCGVYLYSDSSDNTVCDNTYFDNTENIYYETTKQKQADGSTPGFELILTICSVALVLFWKRKKRGKNF